MGTIRITIRGIECESANDAFGWVDASGGGQVVSIGNKVFVVDDAEARRIEATGVPFAYMHLHDMPDGTDRIMTVPVNDD